MTIIPLVTNFISQRSSAHKDVFRMFKFLEEMGLKEGRQSGFSETSSNASCCRRYSRLYQHGKSERNWQKSSNGFLLCFRLCSVVVSLAFSNLNGKSLVLETYSGGIQVLLLSHKLELDLELFVLCCCTHSQKPVILTSPQLSVCCSSANKLDCNHSLLGIAV